MPAVFLISFTSQSGVESSGGPSALASLFHRLRPPPEPLSPLERARVLTFPDLVSACFVSDGQSLIGSAWSCLYPDDLLLSKFSTSLEAWMDVSKVLCPARWEGLGWSAMCVLSDSHSVHRSMLRMMQYPRPWADHFLYLWLRRPRVWRLAVFSGGDWLILSKGAE